MEPKPPISPPDDFPYPCTAAYGRDRYGIWQTVEVAGAGQTFRWISPGSFTMGSPNGEYDREVREFQRSVTLTVGFWLADTACPQALWTALMGENPSTYKSEDHPVEGVSSNAASEFLERWGQQCPSFQVRLPTEAEWEYACRSGTRTPFSFGETLNTDQANFNGNSPYLTSAPSGVNRATTIPVKALPANSWGLYQMHGNVWEWCSDWYHAYDERDLIDPRGPATGVLRVVRGGAYWSDARHCRSACHFAGQPDLAWEGQGFRLAAGSFQDGGKIRAFA